MIASFPDRRTAGILLAKHLEHYRGHNAVVLGLPRGGLPVAAEVARALDLPLDVILVRKVGFPGHAELAVAAIAGPEGRTLVLNEDLARSAGINAAMIERLAAPQRQELARRRKLWLGERGAVGLAGKTAILIDDGLATGATMRAAIAAVREEGPELVVVAVPVAPPDAVAAISGSVDEVVCLSQPKAFFAVGGHYDEFPQVSDDEVHDLLEAAAARAHPGTEGAPG